MREQFRITQTKKGQLAEHLKIRDQSVISKMLAGKRRPTAEELPKIQEFFQNAGDSGSHENIMELDMRGGGGALGLVHSMEQDTLDGETSYSDEPVKDHWRFPNSYVRNELGTKPVNLRIVEVMGQSMVPLLNPKDMVLVDLNHKNPSPPGVYAVFDGFGLVLKHVEPVAYGKSLGKLFCFNGKFLLTYICYYGKLLLTRRERGNDKRNRKSEINRAEHRTFCAPASDQSTPLFLRSRDARGRPRLLRHAAGLRQRRSARQLL